MIDDHSIGIQSLQSQDLKYNHDDKILSQDSLVDRSQANIANPVEQGPIRDLNTTYKDEDLG